MTHVIDKYQVIDGKPWKNFVFPVTATNSALSNLPFPVTSPVGFLQEMHDLHQPDPFWYAKSHLAFKSQFVSCHSGDLICYLKLPPHPFHLGNLELKSGWFVSSACVCMCVYVCCACVCMQLWLHPRAFAQEAPEPISKQGGASYKCPNLKHSCPVPASFGGREQSLWGCERR